MIEKSVTSWSELNELLFEDTWNSKIRRFRSTFAYRGISNKDFKLLNSLSRLGTPYPNMEKNLIKQFKKYAHKLIVDKDTEWHWLSVAQHYGLPTRLLDWTYSPLIAAHFAVVDLQFYDVDGAVWKVNYSQAHDLLQNEYTQILDRYGARIFSVDALSETISDLNELDKKRSKDFDIAIFFEPPAINDRIVNQFAYFSVLSDPFLAMDEWLNKPYVSGKVDAMKIIIPADIKWEIRDKLDQSNINERVLMTGLDGLCAWLKRHYMPRI